MEDNGVLSPDMGAFRTFHARNGTPSQQESPPVRWFCTHGDRNAVDKDGGHGGEENRDGTAGRVENLLRSSFLQELVCNECVANIR